MRVPADRQRPASAKSSGAHLQERLDLRGQRRQHRLQVDRQQAEGLDAGRCTPRAARAACSASLASSHGLLLVDVGVDAVGQRHDLAQRLAVLAARRTAARTGSAAARSAVEQRGRLRAQSARELAVEALGQEAGGAAGDVDVLADQVGVDARDEVLGVEVDVLDAAVQLGGDVVAQPLRVHARAPGSCSGLDAGAAALAHLLAVDGEEAVHEDRGRAPCGPLNCSIAGQNSVWKVTMSLPMKCTCSSAGSAM